MSLEDISYHAAAGGSYGPPPGILSPERPGNDPTTRTRTGAPVTSRPAEGGVVRVVNPNPDNPYGNVATDPAGNVVAVPKALSGVGLGTYFLGALAITAMADTVLAPVVVAFLVSAAIYNANPLLERVLKKGQ